MESFYEGKEYSKEDNEYFGNFSDEGKLLKSRVYNQADATGAVLDSAPYHFIASVRNSFQEHFASVLAPTSGSWNSNPLILVAPSLLVGSHYIFDEGFSDQSSMDSAFSEGTYTFNISRNDDTSTTEFQQSLILTGGSLPSEYPEISNAEICKCGKKCFNVTAIHPLPVPISKTLFG